MWALALVVLATAAVAVELPRYESATVAAFFRAAAVEAEPACRSRLEALAVELRNGSGALGRAVGSFASGAVSDYGARSIGTWGRSSDRWVQRGTQCQDHAEDAAEPWDYCFGRSGDEMLGVCLPGACRGLPRRRALALWLQLLPSAGNASVAADFGTCVASEYSDPSVGQMPDFLFIIGLYLVLIPIICLAAWAYQAWRVYAGVKGEPTLGVRLFLAWSLADAARRLVRMPRDPRSAIVCLCGLRSLAMIWVMLGHSLMIVVMHLEDKSALAAASKHNILFQPFAMFTLSVDVFFLLSGLLTAYNWFTRAASAGERIGWRSWRHWLGLYRHRIARIWPLYAIVVLGYATAYTKMTRRPLWPLVEETTRCQATGWRNLLFINQLLVSPNQCMIWTWYLGNDMLFFLLSPLFLLCVQWRARVGLGFAGLVCVASAACRAAISATHNFSPIHHIDLDNAGDWNTEEGSKHELLYIRPWNRVGPYVVGLAAGWVLSSPHFRVRMEGLGRGRLAVASAAAAALFAWSFFGSYWAWNGLNEGAHFVHNLVYGAFYRTAFAAAVAWLVILCQGGRLSYVSRALGCRLFLVLANVCYANYLLHVCFVAVVWMFWPWYPIQWSGFATFFLGFALQVPFSFMLSLPTTLCIEFPLLSIEALLQRHFAAPPPAPVPVACPPEEQRLTLEEESNI